MRILVLASDNPSPPINGTRIRNYHLWNEMRKAGHEVKVLAITRNSEDLRSSDEKVEFFTFTRKNIFKRIWMRLFHSYHEWPVSDALKQRVVELSNQWKPDIIHAEELRMGQYLPHRSSNKKPLLSLCIHNVESQLITKTLAAPFRFGVKFFNRIYTQNLVRFEKKVFSNAHVLMTYSELDKKIYQNLYPEFHFVSSSNGVNLIELNSHELQLPSPEKLLFLGSLSYLPNIEGLFWLLDEVLPHLKRPIKLTVAGSTPADIVRERLKKENIELLDTPLDLRPVYLDHSLLVVPLLSGSGTRGKILESLMYGRPVLTTPKGVEGLNLKEKEGTLMARSARDFQIAIENWISLEDHERKMIAEKGRDKVISHYTWSKVGVDLEKIWSGL